MAGNVKQVEADYVRMIKKKLPDFAISTKDLKVPTSDFVVGYYTRILEEFGIDITKLSQLTATHHQKLKFVNDYVEGIPLVSLFTALQIFFHQIYIEEFTILDLISPTAKRTLKIVGHIDNFHSYADTKAGTINSEVLALYECKASQLELQEQKEFRINELNLQAGEQARRQDTMKQLERKIEQTRAILLQLKQKQLAVKKDLDKLRDDKYEKEYNLDVIQKSITELDVKSAELQKQVVQSPEQLALQLKRLHAQEEDLKEQLQHTLVVVNVKREQINTYKDMITKPETCHTHLKELIPLYLQLQNLRTLSKEMHKKNQMMMSQREGISQECDKQYELKEEAIKRFTKLSADWEVKNTGLQQEFQDTELELNQMVKKRSKDNSHFKSLQATLLQNRKLVQDKMEQLQQKVAACNLKEEWYKEQVKKYNASAEAYMERDIGRLTVLRYTGKDCQQ